MISLEKLKISSQKWPENEGDLGKFIFAKGFEICPKSNKFPNLVTLLVAQKLVPTSFTTKTHLELKRTTGPARSRCCDLSSCVLRCFQDYLPT